MRLYLKKKVEHGALHRICHRQPLCGEEGGEDSTIGWELPGQLAWSVVQETQQDDKGPFLPQTKSKGDPLHPRPALPPHMEASSMHIHALTHARTHGGYNHNAWEVEAWTAELDGRLD